MKPINNKGITLVELVVALGLSAFVLLAIAYVNKQFVNTAKTIELKDNTRLLIDKELMLMLKRDTLKTKISQENYGKETCENLGLVPVFYKVTDPVTNKKTGIFKCEVTKYRGCSNGAPTCLVSVKESLCDLQKRAKVSMRMACSI